MKLKQLYKFPRAMLVFSLLCSPIAFASFEKAMELYQAQDFDRAYQAFHSMAEIGDFSSMFNLEVMHYRGESVPRDPVQAYAWFSKAGSLAKHQDYLDTAEKVLKKLSVTDKEKSRLLAAEFTKEYSREAINQRIFPKPLSDEDCEPDPVAIKQKPPRYPWAARDKGRMGRVVLEFTISKEGYVRDLMTVSYDKMFKSAPVNGAKKFLYAPPTKDGKPHYHYGHNTAIVFLMAGKKEVDSKKLKFELEKVKRKAEEGDPVSQYVYATRLNVFRSFKDYLKKLDLQYQESNKWYLASAQNGLPHAQFALGRNMIRGRGCEVDEQGGMKWINAAAVGGYSPAQHYLVQNLLMGREEAVNRSAMAWLQNASMSNHYPGGQKSEMLLDVFKTSVCGHNENATSRCLDGNNSSFRISAIQR
ncbi:SEL1-like repeat protein [Exilibacterium tricleocarpae]|uniref:SEL1-like repeat protein n=1 Tax=Exilibacterium tricleocarpae TaxID=2591008 RepID=A0A545TZL6_9GAMM|nr:energy transducer TonB [Exilibacterium tricleocarpae]TQV82660.1 SEL1-like repeat protein [Exilibacterium tricleocarpae]